MATIGTISGSKLIGSPIIVPITKGSVPADATFHRVRIVVTVNTGNAFEFSAAVGSASVYDFDISSALRTIAESFTYTPTALNPVPVVNYPTYNFVINAYDDYMLNGRMQMGQNGSTVADSGYYIGRLTDRERLTNQLVPSRWSRKPTSSPEVVFTGSTVIVAGTGTTPSVSTKTAVAGADGNHYGIDRPRDGYELRFINSLGVHENVFVRCLPTTEVAIHTDKYVISREHSITDPSHGISRKQNDQETWKMSSGPLDRQWQQWYLHELLMAEKSWISVDSQWIRCHIYPEENVPAFDRQKASLVEVPFALTFDINGSPFA